ncbi:hypothetical protein C8R42DRAFT_632509 [Lentinula raphanica]|nr:hypothetical protein C8R42DRAFT_632509 [Lentinula raphanica]
MSRNRKKAKTTVQSPSSTACHIKKLPIELLAEILLYSKSPKDILALARCSKYFCKTLLHESNQFIWRYVRKHCILEPLPEPCARFTESSFAALVFDDGPCEMCGKIVSVHKSFAVRLRICSIDCESRFDRLYSGGSRTKETHKIFEIALPVLETPSLSSIHYWPDIPSTFRYHDWIYGLQDYLDASQNPVQFEQFINLNSRKGAEIKIYMQMCVALQKWERKYYETRTSTKEANLHFSKQLAAREGLNFWDLMNTKPYTTLFRQKNFFLETIQQSDFEVRKADINAELVQLAECRSQRAHETGYSTCRQAVEKHYNRLRTLKKELPLPCLPSFRELPTIHQIQQSTSQSHKQLDTMLKSEPISTLIHSELAKFHADAKNELAEVLGFPDWKSPSVKKLHPVERLSARFQCRKCHRVEAKYRDFDSLDYAGAIMHLCSVTSDKSKSVPPKPFNAGRFEKDTKAMAAIFALLQICGIEDDEVGSHELLSVIGPRITCLSCDGRIVMEPLDVIGHSHRHESMSLALLTSEEVNEILGPYPFTHGIAARLTIKGKSSLEMRNMKIYACRHCVQAKTPTSVTGTPLQITDLTSSPNTNNDTASSSSSTTNKPDAGPVVPKGRQPTLYIFDGLRCHLQERHNVDLIRDEDFICTKDLPQLTG